MKKILIIFMLFFVVMISTSTAQVPGDLNCTGSFNGLDITYWVNFYPNPINIILDTTSCTWANGDMNLDGAPHTIADWWNLVNYYIPGTPGNNPPPPISLDSISLTDLYCSPGDTATMPVYIYSAGSFTGFGFHIEFDSEYINEISFEPETMILYTGNLTVDNVLFAFGMTRIDSISAGNYLAGNIEIIVSDNAPFNTDINLRLIGEDYFPSGISNYSMPTYLIRPSTNDGVIHVIATNVQDHNLPRDISADITAYPNPFNSSCNIVSDNPDVEYINIYDVSGRLLDTIPLNDGQANWNADNYATGTYFARAAGQTNSTSIKLIYLK